MPQFTPPTVAESSSDFFFGRYQVQVGQSVVKLNGHYTVHPYPWLGTIHDLIEGEDYFMGGRTYLVSASVATALEADGYAVSGTVGFGEGGLGLGGFGEGGFGE